jgi:hypothetical protein
MLVISTEVRQLTDERRDLKITDLSITPVGGSVLRRTPEHTTEYETKIGCIMLCARSLEMTFLLFPPKLLILK